MSKPVFAVDVGGVLASLQHDGMPTMDSLPILHELEPYFELWVVSMCGKGRALHTRHWLKQWMFPFPVERQIYIPFRDKNKNAELKKIGARYFIDDRIKHIAPALNHCPKLVLALHFQFDRPIMPGQVIENRYLNVNTWKQVRNILLPDGFPVYEKI